MPTKPAGTVEPTVSAALTAPTLVGPRVRLVPLQPHHAPGLAEAASQDRSTYGLTWVPQSRAECERYIEMALHDKLAGTAVPFAVERLGPAPANRPVVVGSTRFLDLQVFGHPAHLGHSGHRPDWPPGRSSLVPSDANPPSVAEIGSTWYAAAAQRTHVNTDCKLLLLTHAFEVWQVLRVTLKTDARNARSRRAIERLGAVFEGVRRAHTLATDGTVRDSAYYSIMQEEWPAVRARLSQPR